MDGNSPDLNEMFARLVIMGEKTSTHDFSSDVGNTSRGDDLLGSLSISFHTSEGSTSLKLSMGCPMNCLLLNRSLYHRHDAGMNTIHFIHEEGAESR